MLSKKQLRVLDDLQLRLRARSNSVLSFFKKAGFPPLETVTLEDINNLREKDEGIYNELILHLYDGVDFPLANANGSGWQSWLGAIGNALASFGGYFNQPDASTILDYQAEQIRQEAQLARTRAITTAVVAGVVILVVIVLSILIINRKK